MKNDLKIAVVGAGAIGGICAAFIKQAGYDVQAVVRRHEHAVGINEKGIRVSGIKGSFTVRMDAVAGAEQMDPDRDLVLLGVKATAMMAVVEKLPLKEDALVVSLQNGFCENALANVLGRDRVIGCVTGWGATLHSDTELEMTSLGDFIIGNIDGREDPRLPELQSILSHVLETKISDNITGDLYAKLIINSCITSVGAVCGLYLGQMLARSRVRHIFLKIMEEAMAVADAMEVRVAVFGGKLDYYTFLKQNGLLSRIRQHLFLLALGFKYRRLKSSMLQSLERGRKTEVDYLTGFISNHGKRHGIPTPVNDKVLKLVRDIESGQRAVSPANLGLLA